MFITEEHEVWENAQNAIATILVHTELLVELDTLN